MRVEQFNYNLPEELIAQHPIEPRDTSRLLVLNKEAGRIEHKVFHELIDYLYPGDALVLNNTKVMPARLYGLKKETGAKVEVVLLKRGEGDLWETLVRPGRKIRKGHILTFGDGLLEAEVVAHTAAGGRKLKFIYQGIFEEILDKLGQMPLPPYIRESLSDQGRYQTVYAKHQGSAAAPTAGLHFTPELLERIGAKGINLVYLLLHVGLGTFRPVQVEEIKEHKMHAEYFSFGSNEAEILNRVRDHGGKIVAVGTTSVRTLETVVDRKGVFQAQEGWTDIFIYPGYQFCAIDAMVTNFHLPKSTLLMLVSAFAGLENIRNAYQQAINSNYRFYSFGDAMLII